MRFSCGDEIGRKPAFPVKGFTGRRWDERPEPGKSPENLAQSVCVDKYYLDELKAKLTERI